MKISISRKFEMQKNVVLDLGCGKKKRSGTIGVDFSARHDADVIHDLDVFPYPFDDDSVDCVYLDNCLEHLSSPLKVMEELYRILKPGGSVFIMVPYFRSRWAYNDPTHRTFYTINSFAYYDKRHIICQRYDYTDARFQVTDLKFNDGHSHSFIKKIITKIANKWPDRYERFLSTIFPLDEIKFHLIKE